MFRRELTIKGAFAQCHSFDRAVTQLRLGHVDVTGLITHRFALHDFGSALRAVASSDCIKAVVAPQHTQAALLTDSTNKPKCKGPHRS